MTELEKYKKAYELVCAAIDGKQEECIVGADCPDGVEYPPLKGDCEECIYNYFLQQADQSETKPMTNRQWLESLSDEELAKELDKDCKHFCKRFDAGTKCYKSYEDCVKGRLDWLKAEHKESEQ